MKHITLPSIIFWLSVSWLMASTTPAHCETMWWNSRRGFAPFSENDSGNLLLDNDTHLPILSTFKTPIPSSELTFSFRVANRHSHPLKRHTYTAFGGRTHSVLSPGWSIVARGVLGDTLRITLRSQESEEAGDGLSTKRITVINAEYIGPEGPIASKILKTQSFAPNLNPDTGWNALRLSINGGTISLSGGTRRLDTIMSMDTPISDIAEIGFEAMPGALLEIDCISLEIPDRMPESGRLDNTTREGLQRLMRQASESKDEMEGEWIIYDRSLEETLLRAGGDYRLLMVSSAEGYDLLYVEGAWVCGDRWSPGMVKAKLLTTPLPGVWNVIWHDAEGIPISHDIRAQYDSSSSLLTIMFPYYFSSLRLYPIRVENMERNHVPQP